MASRIRPLIVKIEWIDGVETVHPFTKGFDQVLYVANEAESKQVTMGDTSEVILKRTAEDIKDNPEAHAVYLTTYYIGLQVKDKTRKSSRLIAHSSSYLSHSTKLDLTDHDESISLIRHWNSRRMQRVGKATTRRSWVSLYGI